MGMVMKNFLKREGRKSWFTAPMMCSCSGVQRVQVGMAMSVIPWPCTAQATTTQKAGAKMFRAVPPMVWSALRLMAAKASSREKTIPAMPAIRAARTTPS